MMGAMIAPELLPVAPGFPFERFEARLAGLLEARADELVAVHPALRVVTDEVRALTGAGGKRLRAQFVWWGHEAAGGATPAVALDAAAAIEVFHAFALVHDDVMDGADARRGRPAVHHALAAATGAGPAFGTSAAILAGDLAFAWADELLDGCGAAPARLSAAKAVYATMKREVVAGQYLDLLLGGPSPGTAGCTEGDALEVATLKSARYAVVRPLELGAALAGPPRPGLTRALRAYGDAVGLGYQLRDDVLGAVGDPVRTGKSATTDLRDAKPTVLLLHALGRADAPTRARLDRLVGDPALTEADADDVRSALRATGALDHVESLIARCHAGARRALQGVPAPARGALGDLAERALVRDR
jgi:geranylgeranyl diphosphate synthase type I